MENGTWRGPTIHLLLRQRSDKKMSKRGKRRESGRSRRKGEGGDGGGGGIPYLLFVIRHDQDGHLDEVLFDAI